MTINSRQKGARAERELSKLLTKLSAFSCRRGQQYSGANGDPDVVGLPLIHIECKAVERLNLREAMTQAEDDKREKEIPVVMHKKNRKPWLVTLNLEDFMQIYNVWVKSMEE